MTVWRRSLNLALAATLLLSALPSATPRAAAQTAARAQITPQAPSELEAKLAAIEKAVEEGRQKRSIPGLSLVIVKDDPKETEIYLEQPQGDYALKRIKLADATTAAASDASSEYTGPLKEVIGTYDPEGEGPALAVALRDGKVVLVLPGRPAYPLNERSKDVLGSSALHDYFDGAQGGEEATFAPFEPMTGKALEDTRIASDFYAPLEWKRLFKTAEVKRSAKVDGEDAYIVVFMPEKSNAVTNYYSTKTFLLLRQDTLETAGPINIPVTEKFSDYRPVDGVMVAFTRVSNSVTMGDIVLKVREVKFDAPVPEDVFRRKLTR
jgi:hypothetical protein